MGLREKKQKILLFGRHPALSYAEISVFLNKNCEVRELTRSGVILRGECPFIKDLAGIIKAGTLERVGLDTSWIFQEMKKWGLDQGRLVFGLSYYPWGRSQEDKRFLKQTRIIGLDFKKSLKQTGLSCRLVNKKEAALSSVTVQKNKLIEKGIEWLILDGKNKKIGRTFYVQPFGLWSKLDYGRPGRDAVSGMIPPKLASIMIHIAGHQSYLDELFLDPFCGSGTILGQALRMGVQKVWGSDISPKAVKDSKANLKWLFSQNLVVRDPKPEIEFKVQDVRKLHSFIKPNSVRSIVTEPYLGPPQKAGQGRQSRVRLVQELEALYREAAIQCNKALKKGGTMVWALPVFYLGKREYQYRRLKGRKNDFCFLNTRKIFLNNGFVQKDLIMDSAAQALEGYLKERGGCLYGRPGQKVLREIVGFIKK